MKKISIDIHQRLFVEAHCQRITFVILPRTKLHRVNKDADHDPAGNGPGVTHQIDMAGMQVAHGRNKGDAVGAKAP